VEVADPRTSPPNRHRPSFRNHLEQGSLSGKTTIAANSRLAAPNAGQELGASMWLMVGEVSAGLIAAGLGLGWIFDRRARAAFERTLSPAEREEFKGFRRVARWRAFARVLHLRQQLGAAHQPTSSPPAIP